MYLKKQYFLIVDIILVYIGTYALSYLKANGANTTGTKVNLNTKVTLNTLINSSTNLTNANLAGANLKGTKMTSTNLTSANLTNANFAKADLNGWNLSSKDLNGTTWRTLQYQSVNTTVVGGPARNAGGFWIKNFSTTNYVMLPNVFAPGTKKWEMVLRIQTPATFTEKRIIGNYTTDLNAGLVLGIYSTGKINLWLTSNNTSWDIKTVASGAGGNVTLAAKTNYYIKLEFTGTAYNVYVSTDNKTWTLDQTVTSSVAINQKTAFAIGMYTGTGAYGGLVDLANCYIKIDGAYWWRGVTHLLTTSDRNNVNANKKFEIQQIRRSTTVVVHRQIGDIVCTWKQPVLTENGNIGTTNFAVTASHSSGAPWIAFNGNKTTGDNCWWTNHGVTSTSNPCWITWYNPLKIDCDYLEIRNEHQTNENFKTGVFQGSNDNSTWTNLYNVTGTNTAGYETIYNKDLSHYLYHRLYFTESFSTGGVSIQTITTSGTCIV